MKQYELMFVVSPNATEEEIDGLVSMVESLVQDKEGEVLGIEKMGKRKLAYRILKWDEGHYVLCNLRCGGDLISELERRLRVNDLVIRYITVRTDQALKRVEKLKAARLRKIKRKSPSGQPESAAPAI